MIGRTRFTNKHIKECIVTLPHEERRDAIGNLYEAIQVLQLGNFEITDDNQYIMEGKIPWEHHKQGHDAFVSNSGCCATVASWLCYVLANKYDDVGIISMSSLTGNGHVINYIEDKGKLFVVDAYSMCNMFVNDICIETGLISDFRKTKMPTSVLAQVDSLASFADFFARYMHLRSAEYLFFHHKKKYCVPVATRKEKDIRCIIYPDNNCVELISHSRNAPHMKYIKEAPPKVTASWC
ncbi:MAG: hypothetical protein FWF81_01900 [Defluviitaleaceae bacterium]|nr:hypothetical protein [Defluviitaleaceae bacterium]